MKKNTLKVPADYPAISFRISKEQKAEIQRLLELAETRLNQKKNKNEPMIRKNDIVAHILLKELPKVNRL